MTIWTHGAERRMTVEPRPTGGYRLHAQMIVTGGVLWKTVAEADFNAMKDLNRSHAALTAVWNVLTGEEL